jgi:hypothetical protein
MIQRCNPKLEIFFDFFFGKAFSLIKYTTKFLDLWLFDFWCVPHIKRVEGFMKAFGCLRNLDGLK